METQNIEYKLKWDDKYLHYISGFANASGGTLYIGIDDNGTLVGIEDAKGLLERFMAIQQGINVGRCRK